jgi:hypothetical protein
VGLEPALPFLPAAMPAPALQRPGRFAEPAFLNDWLAPDGDLEAGGAADLEDLLDAIGAALQGEADRRGLEP